MVEFGNVKIGERFKDIIDDSKIMEKVRTGVCREILPSGYLGEEFEYPPDVTVELIDFIVIK